MNKRQPSTPKAAGARRGPLDSLLDPLLFKSLGDPTRVRLFACLAKCGRPCSVGEIAECCSVDLSVVSRHLRLLERAGLVAAAKEGRTVFYRARHREVGERLRSLAAALDDCRCRDSLAGAKGECRGKC